VADVAGRPGLWKGAIYWHFAGKRELFLALMDRAMAHDVELARAVGAAPDWRGALHELLARSPAYIERELPLVRVSLQRLLHSGIDEGFRLRSEQKHERWNTVVEQQLARGVAEGRLRPFAPADVTLAIGAAIAGLTLLRLTQPEIKLDSVWSVLEQIFGRGLET